METVLVGSRADLEEAPPDEEGDEEDETADGRPLSDQEVDVDLPRRFPVLGRLGAERCRQRRHAWSQLSTTSPP